MTVEERVKALENPAAFKRRAPKARRQAPAAARQRLLCAKAEHKPSKLRDPGNRAESCGYLLGLSQGLSPACPGDDSEDRLPLGPQCSICKMEWMKALASRGEWVERDSGVATLRSSEVERDDTTLTEPADCYLFKVGRSPS